MKTELKLSQTSRKALCVQVGENAGSEIATILLALAEKIDQLEKNKVGITPISPPNSINLLQGVADTFG